jgi:hypothetical protein
MAKYSSVKTAPQITSDDDQSFCKICGRGRDFRQAQYDHYFRSEPVVCPECKTPIDNWWVAVRQTIESREAYRTVEALGYKTLVIPIDLVPREKTAIDLRDYGVPADARILFIQPHVGGFLLPVDEADFHALHEQTATAVQLADGAYSVPPLRSSLSKRLTLPHAMSFYAAEYGSGPHKPCRADVFVGWLHADKQEIAADALIDAFEALSVERDCATIMPASTAIELKYQNLLAKALRSKLAAGVSDEDKTRKLVKAFMGGRATEIVRQINLLLNAAGVPGLREEVQRSLDALREARNDMAHQGKTKSELSLKTVAQYLCATVFAIHYLNFAEPYLLPSAADN